MYKMTLTPWKGLYKLLRYFHSQSVSGIRAQHALLNFRTATDKYWLCLFSF